MPGARGQSPQRTTPQVLAHAVPGRQKSAPQEQFPPAPRQSSVSDLKSQWELLIQKDAQTASPAASPPASSESLRTRIAGHGRLPLRQAAPPEGAAGEPAGSIQEQEQVDVQNAIQGGCNATMHSDPHPPASPGEEASAQLEDDAEDPGLLEPATPRQEPSPILSPLSPIPFACPLELEGRLSSRFHHKGEESTGWELAPEPETLQGEPETPRGEPSPILSPLSSLPAPEPDPLQVENGRQEPGENEIESDHDGASVAQEHSAEYHEIPVHEIPEREFDFSEGEFHDIPLEGVSGLVSQYTPPHSARSNSSECAFDDGPRGEGDAAGGGGSSPAHRAWQQRRQRGEDECRLEPEAQSSVQVQNSTSASASRNEHQQECSSPRAAAVLVAEVVARRTAAEEHALVAVETCNDSLFPFPEQQAGADGQHIWQVYDVVTEQHLSLHESQSVTSATSADPRSPQMNEETPRSGTTEATDCSNLTSSMPISRCQSEERPPRHPVDGRAAKTPSPFINARRSGSKLPPLSPNVAATPQPHSDAQVLEVTQTLLHYIPKPNFEPSAEERTISPASSVEKVKQRALRGAQVSDVHRAAAENVNGEKVGAGTADPANCTPILDYLTAVRIGKEQARTEQEDAEDKEWRDLLSWDGTVHTPGQGPIAEAMNDATLNFALIAALFCASSKAAPNHFPWVKGAMDGDSAERNAGAFWLPEEEGHGSAVERSRSTCSISKEPVALSREDGTAEGLTRDARRTGHQPIPRLRLSTSYNDQTGRWTSSLRP